MAPCLPLPGLTDPGMRSGNELPPLTTTPGDPLEKFLLVPTGLEAFVTKGNTAMIPLNGRLRLSPGYLSYLVCLSRQTKKVLAG